MHRLDNMTRVFYWVETGKLLGRVITVWHRQAPIRSFDSAMDFVVLYVVHHLISFKYIQFSN